MKLLDSLSIPSSLRARNVFLRSGTKPLGWKRGLATAILLGWLLFVAHLSELLVHLKVQAGEAVRGTIVEQGFGSAALQKDLVWFFLAQLLLHGLLGLAIWLLALLTERAFPSWTVRRFWIIAGWWLLLALTIQVANAALYPASNASVGLEFVGSELIGSLSLYHFLLVPVLLCMAIVLVRAASNSPQRRQITRAAMWAGVILLSLGLVSVLPKLQAETHPEHIPDRPNVIIIGVDSVRSDVVSGSGEAWYAPRINEFLKNADVYPDATTPLARTFPSWVSVLTGRHPTVTGARENLIPYQKLRMQSTVADRFRAHGYRTIYATDDVRFSNIDARFGFDEVLGPPMGASDFILGSLNDVPLANLVANNWLGLLLFPHTYSNRAAVATYEPDTFIEWLDSDLVFEQPTLLAVHLTLPHWPYTWATSRARDFSAADRMYPYLESVAAADRQFGQLMELLQEKRALDNAIVVLLSDHGEALGVPSDNIILSKEAKKIAGPILVWMWGHGTSVLSPHQYSVMLAMKRFDARTQNSAGRQHAEVPASLEDIAPTVLEMAGIPAQAGDFDGMSLASTLARGITQADPRFAERVRFTESGISLELLKQGKVDNRELLEQGSFFFHVAPETGRIELKTEQWSYMVTGKERAAIQGDWLLAAIPVGEGREHRYVLVNRRGGLPRRLLVVPDAKADPVAATLYEALHQRYPGELGPPAA